LAYQELVIRIVRAIEIARAEAAGIDLNRSRAKRGAWLWMFPRLHLSFFGL
jgi:hypothetical protein